MKIKKTLFNLEIEATMGELNDFSNTCPVIIKDWFDRKFGFRFIELQSLFNKKFTKKHK
jgi:hypothetical protein